MGSGLVKCFLTNQTIPEGIEVRVFPIIQSSGYERVKVINGREIQTFTAPNSTICYANCFWKMTGVVFKAIADDYATNKLKPCYENLVSLSIFFKDIIQNTVETLAGKNSYHEKAFNARELITEDLIVNSFTKNDVKKYNWEKAQNIYDTILQEAGKNRILYNTHREKRFLNFAICLSHAYDLMSKSKKREHGAENSLMKLIGSPLIGSDHFHFEISSCFNYNTETSSQYKRFLSSSLKPDDFKTQESLKKKLKELKFVFDFTVFQEHISFKCHIPITPMFGYTQDYQNDDGNNYAKLVEKTNKFVKSFIKDKYY